ncbi:MAG: molecular chaperone HtpG [Anaerolineae bacterium]|nr:molecular chaperone HtpG [Anaerolineae bacterium]
MAENYAFQAEISQVLNILIHSLYKDREIFLRELISNASDALNRVRFEMLTNEDVLDKEAELEIHISVDEENKTIRISDTGIGMAAEEIVDGLGTIARSGARMFLDQVTQADDPSISADIIGQFGVGFYSVFMVAERVEVASRSYYPGAEAVLWSSTGDAGYQMEVSDKSNRGTDIFIHLREDAHEFASVWRIQQIVKKHSDFVTFPIYVHKIGGEEEAESEAQPVNQQTALWRRSPSEVEQADHDKFYSSLTLDFKSPLRIIHTHADAPLQLYALLYIPHSPERGPLTPRQEPGIKLYARKILIDEYNTDLLPEYLWFMQGVVDSEDLPLNVSRETIQSNPLIARLKSVVTRRVLSELQKVADEDPELYAQIWEAYSGYLKHGVVSDYANREQLLPLLRFVSSKSNGALVTLDQVVENLAEGQEAIYYVVADDLVSAGQSVHLDAFRSRGIEVLYLTETIDGLLIPSLGQYEGHVFVAVDVEELDLDNVGQPAAETEEEPIDDATLGDLIMYITTELGDQVKSVRASKVLSSNPARLVTPADAMNRHQERLYRMLDKEIETQTRILEINSRHPLIRNLAARLAAGWQDDLLQRSVRLLYQGAMLADGVHPRPATMVEDVFSLMEAATHLDE